MMKTIVLILACLYYVQGQEECPPIREGILLNGDFSRSDVNSVSFYCHKYYVMWGSNRMSCINGTWTPLRAICVEKEDVCQPPPEVPNAERIGDERHKGAQVTYHCHEDYFIFGSHKLVCNKYLEWDNEPPTCTENFRNVEKFAGILRNQAAITRGELSDDNRADATDQHSRLLSAAEMKAGLELFLLMDVSSSLEVQDLELGKSFLKTLLETFPPDNSLKKSLVRVTVITFATETKVICDLEDESINSIEAASKRIDGIQNGGGGTALEPALSQVLEYKNSLRPGVKTSIFLLTDGEPTVGDLPPEDVAASLKKNHGIEIFAVGIGLSINRTRLSLIASEPPTNHVFAVARFLDLGTIVDLVRNPTPTIPAPGPDACGISSKQDVKSKPWLTAIVTHSNETKDVTFCAGVQICSQWVLTSAACVGSEENISGSQIGIVAGAHDLTKPGHNAYALEIHLTPKHTNNYTKSYRLALLKLDHPVPNTDSRPICLQLNENSLPSPRHKLSTKVLLEGWGTRNWDLSETSITLSPSGNRALSLITQFSLLEEHVCDAVWKKVINPGNGSMNFWRERIFCTGPSKEEKPETDYCVGNLGSPLIAEDDDGRSLLLGVQTTLNGCKDRRTTFIDPVPYLSWINRITDNCQENHKK